MTRPFHGSSVLLQRRKITNFSHSAQIKKPGEGQKLIGPVGNARSTAMFEAASEVPRNQQQKLVAVLDAFVKQHATRAGKRESPE
jgi:hypothetical protein